MVETKIAFYCELIEFKQIFYGEFYRRTLQYIQKEQR